MPIATRPGETFRVSLKKDKELHASDLTKCPWFEFRAVSCLEWKRIAKFRDDPKDSAQGGEVIDSLSALLAEYLVGWGNMANDSGITENPYAPATAAADLLGLLSMREMWELFFLLAGQGVDTDALKN